MNRIGGVSRLPLITVLGLVAVSFAATLGSGLVAAPAASSSPAPVAVAPSASTAPTATPRATPTPRPTPSPSPTSVPIADVPIVPVTNFRSPAQLTGRDEVAAVLAGTSRTYDALELVESEADPILAAIGGRRPADSRRLVLAADAATLAADLAKNRRLLAFLRADAVGPSVRTIGWGDRTLFGVGAVDTVEAWGLTARLLTARADGSPIPAFDPGATWTLVAGGDILLDRGVALAIRNRRNNADFPFDGGSADITSRYCCSSFGWRLPRVKRSGDAGAVRALVKGADLAIANFENPAPDRFRFHASGTVFSADPKLIAGLANAGIDYVSLANNHIGDAGRNGIIQTIENLADHGIVGGGAGATARAARRPVILEAGGTTVGILAYDTIAPNYRAGAARPGSASMSEQIVREDVKKARDAGAQVVIVFPHWGGEYDATPFAGQQALARASIDAGADIVIGNHAHWAGALEIHKGKPIWYALGNFVFDQSWSEPTMTGITLDLTFRGSTLVQARMRPHIILDKAQPNFLDPAADGRTVMGQIFDASGRRLPW